MNSPNKIGIRIAGIVLIGALILFGIWKGIMFGISTYQASQVKQSPSPIVSLQPTLSPAPEDTQLAQDFLNVVDTAKETLVGYTKQYVESLPVDSTKEQVLNQKSIEAFVEANRGTLLPELPAGTVKTSPASSKKAIQTYLDSISPVQNKEIVSVTGDMISSALAKQQSNEELQAMVPVLASIEKNYQIFQSVKAPKEAEALHTKLLQATQALLNNVKLLQEMRNDFVGGLIGQKNLADLNGVFGDIGNQILTLETKYNIK